MTFTSILSFIEPTSEAFGIGTSQDLSESTRSSKSAPVQMELPPPPLGVPEPAVPLFGATTPPSPGSSGVEVGTFLVVPIDSISSFFGS